MTIFQSDSLEPQLASELIDDISRHYLDSEKSLIELDGDPNNSQLLHQLFRSVHTIKGNLGVVGIRPLMPLMDEIENILEALRRGIIHHTPLLGDLILLMLDDVKTFMEDYLRNGQVLYDEGFIASLSQRIASILSVDEAHREAVIAKTIRIIDPAVAQVAGVDDTRLQADNFIESLSLAAERDLSFFRDLMGPVEARSRYWSGRSDRILKLSLTLNQLAGKPVDEDSLAIAVYVHDFGMAFIPEELLQKQSVLSDSEILLMRSHVEGSVQLLKNMDRWEQAREIVNQHHEASNGSGYPYGLREKNICDGAKIIAIADTFDALTHQRAYSTQQKRPIIRAIKEINDCAGKQLSPHWVNIFNRAMESILAVHRSR